MATYTKCNMCGKEFEDYDDFSLYHMFGYGSKRDGSKITLDLCNNCLDKLVDEIQKCCVIDPIEEPANWADEYYA